MLSWTFRTSRRLESRHASLRKHPADTCSVCCCIVQAKDTVSNAVEQVKTFLSGDTGDYQPEVSAKQVSDQKS